MSTTDTKAPPDGAATKTARRSALVELADGLRMLADARERLRAAAAHMRHAGLRTPGSARVVAGVAASIDVHREQLLSEKDELVEMCRADRESEGM